MKRILLVAALALGACAAPSSYDGLAGGTKEDAAVAAPRPVSPISVSLIASNRPRLRWDLGTTTGSNLTGAVVEMSRTRDFAGDVKRYEAKGIELVVPEDLEPGIWFWRLKGNASGSIGTAPSVVWEMLVRGPAAHGSSDMPTRAMVDMNGDGEPDLLIGATGDDSPPSNSAPNPLEGTTAAPAGPPSASNLVGLILLYGGNKERGFAAGMSDYWSGFGMGYSGPMAIGGGTDFNGDGLTDVIESGSDAQLFGSDWNFEVTMAYASKKAGKPEPQFDLSDGALVYQSVLSPSLPSIREGGDVNGDGYGDAVVGFFDTGVLVLNTASSKASAQVNIDPGLDADPGPHPLSRVAMGGFDANGDGLADMAFGVSNKFQPSVRAQVSPGDRASRVGKPAMMDAPDARLATAFAAGDFDGDGIDDVAVTNLVGSSTRICVWFGDREKLLRPGPCLSPAAGDTQLGASLTAADIEGDGIDELLATAKSGDSEGVRVVRLTGGALSAAPIGLPGLGVRLTTIYPGRPGKARWAAASADGTRVGVFEGADLRTTLTPPPGIVKGFGRGLR